VNIKTHTWNAGHQGGRFTALPLQQQLMLKGNRKRCSVFGVTEGIGLPRIEGFGRRGHECKFYFDKQVWDYRDHDVESVKTNRWVRGTSARTTVEFEYIILEHQIQQWKLLRVEGHLPAHLFIPAQRRANEAALHHLGEIIREFQDEFQPDETDLGLDLNRDLRLDRNVKLVERSLKGTGVKVIMPPHGTFKARKIDLLGSTADGNPHMLPSWKGYDHTGYYADLAA
jgi:hypothetical protein